MSLIQQQIEREQVNFEKLLLDFAQAYNKAYRENPETIATNETINLLLGFLRSGALRVLPSFYPDQSEQHAYKLSSTGYIKDSYELTNLGRLKGLVDEMMRGNPVELTELCNRIEIGHACLCERHEQLVPSQPRRISFNGRDR